MTRILATGLAIAALLGTLAPAAAQQTLSGSGHVTGKDLARGWVYIDDEPYRVTPATSMRSEATGRETRLVQLPAPDPGAPISPLIYARFQARASASDDVPTLLSLTLLEANE